MYSFFGNHPSYIILVIYFNTSCAVLFYGNAWEVGDTEWYLLNLNARLLQLKIIYFSLHKTFCIVRIQSDCGQLFNSS